MGCAGNKREVYLMKKRALSLILATAMVAGSLVACGGSTGAASSEPAAEAEAETEAETEAEEGSVLNVYCWNEEFKTRVKDQPDAR